MTPTITLPLRVGQRIEIPVHCDLWMQGARFATVRKVTDLGVLLKMDHPQVKQRQFLANEHHPFCKNA
jgi:hypothetical protein